MYGYTFFIIFISLFIGHHQTIELYDKLNHLIEYVTNHTDSQKADLMLGIYLCEGNFSIFFDSEFISFVLLLSYFF